jgi:hypothetical protein
MPPRSQDPTTLREWVTRIRQARGGLSRNRHFDLYLNPAARSALRLVLRLSRLQRDLQAIAQQGQVRILTEPMDHRIVIELEVPALRLRRRVFISSDELAILREDPKIASILASG